MKKGKVISMPNTPEALIRTRARQLPVGKCFINQDWKKAMMASVIVTRKHVNGNLTYGFYLVDLNLLGVKDCFFAVNESPVDLGKLINSQIVKFIECDYVLAHNIIFESIAFADTYGFKPVKDFLKTGIYILEEDTEEIPSMDIPLGENGVPVVFTAPDRDMQREIAILEKTAGIGNFIIYCMSNEGYMVDDDDDDDDEYDDDEFDDDEFDDDDDDDDEFDDDDDEFDDDDDEFDDDDDDFDDDDDDFEFEYDDDDDDDDDFDDDDYNDLSYEEILNEIMEIGIDNYLEEYKEDDLLPMQRYALSDITYFAQFGMPDTDIMDGMLALILKDKRIDSEFVNPLVIEKYANEIQSIVRKLVDDEDTAYEEMEALIAKHSDDLDLGILYINMLRDLDLRSELEKMTLYWYNRAADHFEVRLLYAELLIEQERFDEVFELFGNLPGLNALTKEDVQFTDVMISEFCACYIMAWLSKDNIELAEAYYRIIILLENWTPFVKNALMTMMCKRNEAVSKKAQATE
jgi:hypothetical protein